MSRFEKRLAETKEGVRLAIDALRANKFRSFMTILGVTIGVGAVIIVNTIMDGFTSYVESSIDKIGNNVIYVEKWDEHTDFDNLTEEERRRPNIRMKEAMAIQEMCPLIPYVSPEKKAYNNLIKYEDNSIRTPDDFRGCWPTWPYVTNREIEYGRFIDDADMNRAANVCVIGPEVANALFATHEEAIGKEITVNSYKFRVIGVQGFVDDIFGISENDFVYIPMTTFERLYPNTERVYLLVSAVDRERFDEAYNQVISALRRVRGLRADEDNNFGLQTQDYFKKQVGDITKQVQLWASAVASVGLMVGVIGVMNIMLVAVTQRTREIGIRKAIGARKSNILFQFLVEAATLTCIGGLVGIAVGALVGLVVTSVLDWRYFLSPMWIMIALAMSAGTGIVAGLYPAWRAARVDPIIALQYE